MTSKSLPVVHDTVVVERRYPVSPSMVFAAYADVEQRRRWFFPGERDDWVLAEMTQDFRVGGVERARFGPRAAPTHWSEGRFLDIVENERVVSAGTMHDGPRRTSATLFTLELAAEVDGCRLTITDQSAFLDGREAPQDRRSGWGQITARLAAHLATGRPPAVPPPS